MNVQSILGVKGADVSTIGQAASLSEAAQKLRELGIGALVVSGDGTTIEGILSERDVVSALDAHGAGALSCTVGSAMSSDVFTCRIDDPVEHLMELMTTRRVRHVPVVDDDGAMQGIVSIGDVVKGRLGQLENENQALNDYIHYGR